MKIRAGSQLVVPVTCLSALAMVALSGCGGSGAESGGLAGGGAASAVPPVGTNGTGGASVTGPVGAAGASVTNPPPSGTVPVGSAGAAPVGAGGAAPIGAGGAITGIAGAPGPNGGAPGVGGATSTGGATGAAGSTSNPTGCAQGTYCKEASDLSPPDASKGFQLVSPSSVVLKPGEEQFLCYYKNIPSGTDVNVSGFRSWMTKGSSHHFITYLVGASSGGIGGLGKQADGTLVSCGGAAGQWVYATSQSGLEVGMDMPDTVGLPMPASSQLVMNMHFVNTTETPQSPVVKLNVLYGTNIKYKAAAMISFNTQIAVPPGGTQTVRGTCTPPAGSNFFVMSTHTHKWATAADVNYVSGGQTTNIVHTTNYEQPGTHVWTAPNFLTTKAGDTFTYSCAYQNNESFTITVGETAQKNEMCMAIGYYFPAGNASCF